MCVQPLGTLSCAQYNDQGFSGIERAVEAKRKGCWCMQQFSSEIMVGYSIFAEKKLLFVGLKNRAGQKLGCRNSSCRFLVVCTSLACWKRRDGSWFVTASDMC